jgi:hypothetical protein
MKYSLHNFKQNRVDLFTEEEMQTLMHDAAGELEEETILAYLPADSVYHSLFHARRYQGSSNAAALADALQTYLLAGTQKRQIFLRGPAGQG